MQVVEFGGAIAYDLLAQAYAGASLVLNPRLRPTAYDQSLVVAMATGLPVIASRIGDVEFVAVPDRDVLYVPPGDADALARGIVACLTDHALAARLGRAAEERIASRFTLEETIRGYSALLESLC